MYMKVYIAGPMTGIPDFNFPAFHAAADRWRVAGHKVFNPADNAGGDTSQPWDFYMRIDIAQVIKSDAVAVLPGWQRSKGASLEVHIAQTLGVPVLDAGTMEPYTESATQEAERLVHGNRGADYGHPIEDFTRTGRMWGAILGIPDVDPGKVALCMIAVKMSRECNKPKRDNAVDIAGYAETLAMVRERQESSSPLVS